VNRELINNQQVNATCPVSGHMGDICLQGFLPNPNPKPNPPENKSKMNTGHKLLSAWWAFCV
jgi:hypothetical protein